MLILKILRRLLVKADAHPRYDHMDDIIEFIVRDSCHAYGILDVYYRTEFDGYGKPCHQPIDDLK